MANNREKDAKRLIANNNKSVGKRTKTSDDPLGKSPDYHVV